MTYDNFQQLANRLRELLKTEQTLILDVGAGQNLSSYFSCLLEGCKIIFVDPDEEALGEIAAGLRSDTRYVYEVRCAALADKEGFKTFHITRSPVNSSLKQPNPVFARRYKVPGMEVVSTQEVYCRTIDTLIEAPDRPALLKVDCQGIDLEVLMGAERHLNTSVVAVIAETAFLALYDGQKLFPELCEFLRIRGYNFYGFLTHRAYSPKLLDHSKILTRERWIWGDAIFFREGDLEHLCAQSKYDLLVISLGLDYLELAAELAISIGAEVAEAVLSYIKCIHQLSSDEALKRINTLTSRAASLAAVLPAPALRGVDHSLISYGYAAHLLHPKSA